MKAEIILMLLWASVSLSARQQRSTVLTDESKRIVEHFDFSNFDKQEALNYIDRQRFENQIRGKRSHTKTDHKGIIQNIQTDSIDSDPDSIDSDPDSIDSDPDSIDSDPDSIDSDPDSVDLDKIEANELPTAEENNPELNSDLQSQIFDNCPFEYPKSACQNPLQKSPKSLRQSLRNRRRHHIKKKRKYKTDNYEVSDPDPENEEADAAEVAEENHRESHRKRKRVKKKKKKKKKKKRHYWDKWSAWSPCSVTCGRGRRIRWRKCIVKNCTTGELEMGEKTCQLPACNLLTKLLGFGGR